MPENSLTDWTLSLQVPLISALVADGVGRVGAASRMAVWTALQAQLAGVVACLVCLKR